MSHRPKHRNAALRRRIETGRATNYDLNHPDGQARWQAMLKTFTPQEKRRATLARKAAGDSPFVIRQRKWAEHRALKTKQA
jgi:hypothetical protein